MWQSSLNGLTFQSLTSFRNGSQIMKSITTHPSQSQFRQALFGGQWRTNLYAWFTNENFTQRLGEYNQLQCLLNFTVKQIFLWEEKSFFLRADCRFNSSAWATPKHHSHASQVDWLMVGLQTRQKNCKWSWTVLNALLWTGHNLSHYSCHWKSLQF